jgi:hypothetical protein
MCLVVCLIDCQNHKLQVSSCFAEQHVCSVVSRNTQTATDIIFSASNGASLFGFREHVHSNSILKRFAGGRSGVASIIVHQQNSETPETTSLH